MSDEFISRYQNVSHEDLWRQLKAGDPDQVDKLAAAWKSMHDTAHSLASSLTSDLDRLTAGWSSSSGTEYQSRLHLISGYSQTMAEEFSKLQRGLTLMSGPLRTALKQAENPADTDNNDKAFRDAAIGTVVLGPAGGVLGGLFGHHQDQEEKDKAHQRMVQVVATLAAEYATSGDGWSDTVPVPPPGLPGTITDPGPGGRSGPGVTAPGSVGSTHFTVATTRGIDDPASVAKGPKNGTGTGEDNTDDKAIVGPDGKPVGDTVPTGTTLAGDGTLLGAGFVGVGGLAGALYGAGGGGPAAAALLTAPGGYPMGGAAGAGARGLGPHSTLAADELAGRRAGNTLGSGRQTPAGTGRTHGEDDAPDERLTWLTEDDMVWGADPTGAPSVLGGTPLTD